MADGSSRQVTEPAVAIEALSKRFDTGVAIEDLTFAVGERRFVSLVGPSGCGKSTALRIIAGLGEPTSGMVDWPRARYDASGMARPEIGHDRPGLVRTAEDFLVFIDQQQVLHGRCPSFGPLRYRPSIPSIKRRGSDIGFDNGQILS